MSIEVGRDWVRCVYGLRWAGVWDLQGELPFGYRIANWC